VRLFIALPLPPEVAAAAAALCPAIAGLRPVRPELLHITLAFVGRVPDPQLADVVAATRDAARTQAAFDVSLARSGRFPESGRPHVVWIGMAEGAAERASLAEAVRAALAARGVPFDAMPFRPHVTLARVKDDVDREAARAIVAATDAMRFAPLRYRADAVIPFESVLSPKGPRYTPRAAVPLGVGR
jgi:2'-5' RNA ligase